MNKEQAKLFELLEEFDVLCRESGVQYFLTGETLKHALENGSIGPNAAYASVLMTGDNCRKFMDALTKKGYSNRELDYWGNNPTYPDFTLRYVASDTTAFDMTDYLNYRAHGMYIEVEILRGFVKSRKAGTMRALERVAVISALGEDPDSYWTFDSKEKMDKLYYRVSKMLRGEAGIRRKLFEFFSKECCKPSARGMYSVCHNGNVIKGIPKEIFEGEIHECVINGRAFPIPSDCEKFIRKAGVKSPETFVIDTERAYTDVIESAGLATDDFRKIHEADLRFADNEKAKKKYFAVARRDWQVVMQTDARFRMWKEYMPRKESLLKMYEAGNYEGLSEEFKEYDEEMDKILAYKRSFSFDNELLDVYIHTLRHNGQNEKADNVIRWMPESHLKDIVNGNDQNNN